MDDYNGWVAQTITAVPHSLTSMVDYYKKQFAQTVINEADIVGDCTFTDRTGYLHFVSEICNTTDYELDNRWICSKAGLYQRILDLC